MRDGSKTWQAQCPLPTIGAMRALGLVAFDVHCLVMDRFGQRGCGHDGHLRFDDLALPDYTIWIRIPWRRRLVCSRCGTRSYEISLDWRDHVAHGNGKAAPPQDS